MNKILNAIWLKLTLEPVLFLDVVKQLLNVLIVFQLIQWKAEQLAGFNIFIGLLLSFVTRQSVTANPKVDTVKTNEQVKIESQSKQ